MKSNKLFVLFVCLGFCVSTLAETRRQDKEAVKPLATQTYNGRSAIAACLISARPCLASQQPINRDQIKAERERNRERVKEISNITDAAELAKIARTDPNERFREAALNRITDMSVVADVAQHDSVPRLRREALRKLPNDQYQALFTQIARNDSDPGVRGMALHKIHDEAEVAKILKTEPETKVRQFLLRDRVSDPAIIADFAQHDPDPGIRYVSVRRLSSEKDQAILISIARTDVDAEVRSEATKLVTSQSALAEIARAELAHKSEDKSEWVRQRAIERITDVNTVNELLGKDPDLGGRYCRVTGRLLDPTGKPLAKARVYFVAKRSGRDDLRQNPYLVPELVNDFDITNADGLFAIDVWFSSADFPDDFRLYVGLPSRSGQYHGPDAELVAVDRSFLVHQPFTQLKEVTAPVIVHR